MDLIKDYFLKAHPNPQRVGCPDELIIRGLAEDRLAASHPGRLHMAECSECFAEYRGFRLKWVKASKGRREVLTRAIAASLTIFAAGEGFWEYQHIRAGASPVDVASSMPVESQVDLFNAGTFRGPVDGINVLQSVTLPAAIVHLHLTLPRFSDEGEYAVLVSKDNAGSQVLAKAAGFTTEMSGREVLDVTMDLRSAKSGTYFLATVRGADNGTYYYPLTVKQR